MTRWWSSRTCSPNRSFVPQCARRGQRLKKWPSFSSSLSSNRDPDTDASLRGRIVMLGAVSPVLGALNVLSNAEPLIATRFTVVLTSAVTSVDHLQLFDHDGRVIGAARLDSSLSGNATYVLNLRTRDLQIERREDYGFYVRAKLKAKNKSCLNLLFKIAAWV